MVAAAAGALQEGDEAAALDGVPHGPRHVPDAGEVLALAGVDVDDQPVGTLERAGDDVPAVQRDGAELDEPDEVGGLLDLGVVHDVVRVLLALAARGVDGVQALRRALPGVLLDEPAGVQAVGEALQGQGPARQVLQDRGGHRFPVLGEIGLRDVLAALAGGQEHLVRVRDVDAGDGRHVPAFASGGRSTNLLVVDRVRLSKRLSRALRHDPGRVGLTLDAQGWVSLDALCAALQVSRADVEDVVAHGSKARFELADGRIRARYGHSLPGHVALPPADPPDELFHGTSSPVVDAILRDGLRPRRPPVRPPVAGPRHRAHGRRAPRAAGRAAWWTPAPPPRTASSSAAATTTPG